MLKRGEIVAGYRIDGALGAGSMSAVYRATQLSLGRAVALKLLPLSSSDDNRMRTRFEREARRQASLEHPHVATVYEAGHSELGLFLAMQLIEGPTLKKLILGHEIDPCRSLRLLGQIADALDAAHGAGLVHRDIKPQNILVGPEDHAYLADFGFTKACDEAERLTGTGQLIGTIDYAAPEQIQGEVPTSATDSYAFAAVLYECLTGEVPFPRPSEAATLFAHLAAPPPRVSEHRAELPGALDEVIALGMAKEPGLRPSATDLVASATEALMAGSAELFAPA